MICFREVAFYVDLILKHLTYYTCSKYISHQMDQSISYAFDNHFFLSISLMFVSFHLNYYFNRLSTLKRFFFHSLFQQQKTKKTYSVAAANVVERMNQWNWMAWSRQMVFIWNYIRWKIYYLSFDVKMTNPLVWPRMFQKYEIFFPYFSTVYRVQVL